jgi:hypothetical protein
MIYLCFCSEVEKEIVTIVSTKIHALTLGRNGSCSVLALLVLPQFFNQF